MNLKDKIWIKSMEWFYKYWGCHQLPERSFSIFNYQLPICARCTGIIIGGFISLILIPFIDLPYYALIMIIPMILDGFIQLKTSYESNNFKRFITGFLYGFEIIAFISHTCKIFYKV